jgi:hypothetical protein
MKKLIFILAFLFVIASIATAQEATFSIKASKNFKKVSTNYTLTNTTVLWFQWDAARGIPATQDYQANLDSLSGNHTNIAIKLFGKKFSDDSWTQIGSTVNSTDGTATETISNTVLNRFRFYKTEFTGTGTGTTNIDFQKFKVWNE